MFILRYTVWPVIFCASWVIWQTRMAVAMWPHGRPRMLEERGGHGTARPRDRERPQGADLRVRGG